MRPTTTTRIPKGLADRLPPHNTTASGISLSGSTTVPLRNAMVALDEAVFMDGNHSSDACRAFFRRPAFHP